MQPEVKASISLFMAYVHTTVNEMSKVYLATERRYNYTTPKTFLEQIKLYQSLLARKRMELVAKIERLENGLMKLQSTASQVGRAGRGQGRAAPAAAERLLVVETGRKQESAPLATVSQPTLPLLPGSVCSWLLAPSPGRPPASPESPGP